MSLLTQSPFGGGATVPALGPALERLERARVAARERLRRCAPAGWPEWLRLESRGADLRRRLAWLEESAEIGQGVRELSWLLAEELAGAYASFLPHGVQFTHPHQEQETKS